MTEAAFKQIFDRNYKLLCAYAFRITSDTATAEDVVTESFIKIWQRRERFTNLKDILSYLYVITRNGCIDVLNQRKRIQVFHEYTAYKSMDFDNEIQNELIRAKLIRLLILKAEKLPPKMYEAFKLIYIAGLTLPKTAELLGVSVNTIKTQKASFLKKIRNALFKKDL